MIAARLRGGWLLIWLCSVLLCRARALGSDIFFSVEPSKDTVLVYEQENIRVQVRNDGAVALVRRPYTFAPEFKIERIVNLDANEDVATRGVYIDRIGQPDAETILEPGEERLWTDEVLVWAATTYADPSRPQHYLPPSNYAVICTWRYDPNPRGVDPTVKPLSLVDTARFTVIPATGPYRDALEDFLCACRTCYEQGLQACTDAHWRVACAYPETPYATESLGRIIEYVIDYRKTTLRNVDMDSVLMTFLLASPDDWRCRRYLPMTLKRLDGNARRQFLLRAADMVPGTFTGASATRQLLQMRGNE